MAVCVCVCVRVCVCLCVCLCACVRVFVCAHGVVSSYVSLVEKKTSEILKKAKLKTRKKN